MIQIIKYKKKLSRIQAEAVSCRSNGLQDHEKHTFTQVFSQLFILISFFNS